MPEVDVADSSDGSCVPVPCDAQNVGGESMEASATTAQLGKWNATEYSHPTWRSFERIATVRLSLAEDDPFVKPSL